MFHCILPSGCEKDASPIFGCGPERSSGAIKSAFRYWGRFDHLMFHNIRLTNVLFRAPRVGCARDLTFPAYLCLHKISDLRVSIAPLASAVASGSPSRTRPTRSGDSQATWTRLLT